MDSGSKGQAIRALLAALVQAAVFFCCLFLGGNFHSMGRVEAATFTDLHGHWAAAGIYDAAKSGYLHGYPDGSFQPDRKITRAEFVSLVNNYYRFDIPASHVVFKDVSKQDWFFTVIAKAIAAGFCQGYPGGYFNPGEAITRQEAAGVLGKILAIADQAGGKTAALNFADTAQIGAWAKPAVAGLVEHGLFSGYPDGNFRPRQAVTRAEAAVLLLKAEDYLQKRFLSSYLVVEGDRVNIRSGPGESFAVLGQVKQQDVLKAESFCCGWFRAEGPGSAGWITGRFVQECAAPSPKGVAGTLEIQVLPGERTLAVNLSAGQETAYSWEKREDADRLVVYAPGVKFLAKPPQDPAGQAGLEKIVARLSADSPAGAEVEFHFAAGPVPVSYSVQETGPGQLQISIPYQLLEARVEEKDDLVVVSLLANVPINYQIFTLRDPRRVVVDLPDLILNPLLAGWETKLDTPFLQNLRLGQFLPEVSRLAADLASATVCQFTPDEGDKRLILEFRQATAPGKIVCLDPGHGGADPGAVGPAGTREKEVNLAISLQTAEFLRAAGIEVILTRKSDHAVDLLSRGEIANSCGADLFLSIHANAAKNPAVGGTSTYTYYGGGQKEERDYFSRLLQTELVAALGLRDAGIFNDGFAVLKNTQMPAALVEVAFISCPPEEKLLANKDFQQQAAGALARAIIKYFTE